MLTCCQHIHTRHVGSTLSVPRPTPFLVVLPTCWLTCWQHVGPTHTCLSIQPFFWHLKIRHSQLRSDSHYFLVWTEFKQLITIGFMTVSAVMPMDRWRIMTEASSTPSTLMKKEPENALVASHQWVLRKNMLGERTQYPAVTSFPTQIPQLHCLHGVRATIPSLWHQGNLVLISLDRYTDMQIRKRRSDILLQRFYPKMTHLCIRFAKRGWLYGIKTDSYKSRISDGVLVQKQNCTSWCLKSHASVSQLFGTKRTHSRIPGRKGEALFSKLRSFSLCLPIID